MNNKEKMLLHSGALIAYATMYQFPETNSDLFGWAVFYGFVAVSVLGLWKATMLEIQRVMDETRR